MDKPFRIQEHLKKKYWRRRIVGDMPAIPPTDNGHYELPDEQITDGPYQYLTQEDFLREIEPSAHDINSKFQSTRPIKELVEREVNITNEDGTVTKKKVKEWQIVGWDNLETTRCGLQRRIALTKAAHFAGDGWGIYNEQSNKSKDAHKRFDTLNSWKDVAGYDSMLMEAALSCFQTGDFGAYVYVTAAGDIEYKSYSYLDGYEIFPDIDENRNDVYYVLYSLKGKHAVDIFSADAIETWVQADLTDKDNSGIQTWFSKVKNWFKTKDYAVSEDGWHRVARKETQTPKGLGQFVYWRIPDIPSGAVQEDISALERTLSYVAEGVKATTFDTLFIKATKIKNLPGVGGAGNVIGVEGDVDSIKAADAKRIAPSDPSSVATIDIKEKKESIYHTALSVVVDPEILRSGADSGSAMRLCFNDEIKWCMTMQPTFIKPLKRLVAIHKALVAKIENDPEYTNIRCSVGINIWIPQNFSENVENTCKLKYAGIISAENSRHELDLNYPDDIEIVGKESEKDLYRSTFVPLQAKHDARVKFGVDDTANDVVVTKEDNKGDSAKDNPNKPKDPSKQGVTNQATNK